MKFGNYFLSKIQALLGLIVVTLLAFAPLLAQTGANTGLRGRVTDQSGAVIPGTAVTVTKADTGERRTTTTNATGDWEVRFLTAGPYSVTFENQGFKKLTRSGVTVTTSELATLDVQMDLGELGQTVEVTADAQMISSSSATVVRTLDRRELEDLPTSSRNFTQLLVIEPGVSADISELLSNNNASISPSVNGARTTNNSFVYNGIDVTNLLCCNDRINGSRGQIDQGGGTLSRNIAPAPETLEEVKLQTSLYDAATGRNGGGNFQLISKSGTNEFHGTVYHYFQNDKLIANEFFYNRAGLEKPMLRRNEGGFTVGGPIIKNKTFFFGSYQLTRATTSYVNESNNIVRMPQALTDDRSDEGINKFAAAIWQPQYGPVNYSVINPISRQFLKATFPDGRYLIPSGANGFNCSTTSGQVAPSCQVLSVIPASFKQDQFSTNIDHQITQDNKLSGKFFLSDQPSVDPLSASNALTNYEVNEKTEQRTFSLTDVHVFSPTIINEFRAGFFRNNNSSLAVPYFTNAEFGLQNPLAGLRPDLSHIVIRGDRDVGDQFQFGTPADDTRDVQNTFTYGDTLSFTKGKHSVKVGGEFRRHQLNGNFQEDKHGRLRPKSWFDFLTVGYANPADRNRARQFNDIIINYGETIRGYRMSDFNAFVADDWKVSSNLTFNIGVRWEYFGMPYEVNGMLATFDFPAAVASGVARDGFVFASNFKPESLPGATEGTLRYSERRGIMQGDWNNLMPRFGFAWSPFGKRNFVIRGGYGMFYERTTGAFANSLRNAAPFLREAQISNAGSWNEWANDVKAMPVPDFYIGFDDGEPYLEASSAPGEEFESFEVQAIDPNLSTPYSQQWSLNFQWEFKPNWLAEIGYTGTKGTKLLQIANVDQALDVDAVGFLPRAGVPGGGFIGNYYDVVDDQFVSVKTPWCDVFDDPGDCTTSAETRMPVLGFDENEGVNTLYSNANSIYNSLQASLQKRFSQGYMFNANYTFSRSLDTFSDEGQYQIQHDQTRPYLNRGLSDFHRKHRFILSGTWDLPFKGNRLINGWSISTVGTFQSGRPITILDGDYSGFLFESSDPRPNIVPGATHADLVSKGPVNERVDNFLNRNAVASSGAYFGNMGRNVVIGPDQRRVDLVASKLTRVTERVSLEFRAEFYNAFNTVTFRAPENDITESSYGQIDQTRGGPRVIQLGLKLRF
jgi:hypothetical protein